MHGDGALDTGTGFFGATGKAVDTYGGQIALNFGGFTVGGYGAYSTFSGGNDFNWLAGLAFNDLSIKGGQLGIYGGQLPQYRAATGGNPFLIEGYYNLPFNEFLTITPAVIYGDANNGSTDETTLYGVIRTTFRF